MGDCGVIVAVTGRGEGVVFAAVTVRTRASGLVRGLYGHCSLGGKRVMGLTFLCLSGTRLGPTSTPRSMGSRLTGVGEQRSSVVHFVQGCRRSRLGPVVQADRSVTIGFSTSMGRRGRLVVSRVGVSQRLRSGILGGVDRAFGRRTKIVGGRTGRVGSLSGAVGSSLRGRRRGGDGLLGLVSLCSSLTAYKMVSNGQGRGLGTRVGSLVDR